MALQFPDFDPVLVAIPSFPVAWLGSQPMLVLSGAIAAATTAALMWRSEREKKISPNAPQTLGSQVLWNAVWFVAGAAVAALVLHFVVSIFHLDRVGPFPIRWYALAYIAGIALGYLYIVSMVKNRRLWGGQTPTATQPQIESLMLWVTFAIILGGRIGYVLFYMLVSPRQRDGLAADPAEIFEIWTGGMSFHGAAIGVGLALIGFARANRLALLGITDLVAAAEPIGQCFGRLANFVNGELWGRPTNVPWGMVFCNSHTQPVDGHCAADVQTPSGEWVHAARHPSQLYEAALEGVLLFLVLWFVTHRLKWLQRPGAATGLWLIGYGAIRIALENVRNPDIGMPNFPLGLTMGMMLSIPMIVLGAALIWWALHKAPPAPAAPAEPQNA